MRMPCCRSLSRALCVLAVAAAPLRAQITAAEYAARRDSLAARVHDGVIIAFGGRTPITDFGPFYQEPAFHYLTGYDYADAELVMVVRDGRPATTLFAARTEPRRSLYYGIEPDSADIARDLGLAWRPDHDFIPYADSLAAGTDTLYTLRDVEDADFASADSLTRGTAFFAAYHARHPGVALRNAHPILDQLRAHKSAAELALLRKAAEISSAGHVAMMRAIQPGMHEYDLQAIAEYTFRRGGSERPAYGSIVGAGEHGTQLHYMKDRAELTPGELVVIDAAAEYHGYAADITRTLPVSGTFTPDQRAIYQIVRDAQAAAERNVKPGMSLAAAQDSSVDVRARGLARLGLVESPTALFDPPWPADCARVPRSCYQVQLWAIHGISHGLGLAVHDPMQAYYGDHTLRAGDAFTIEPGIYINARSLDLLPDTPRNREFKAKVLAAVKRYQNTGVRIEDDYVVTPRGTERISTAPREISEIEAMIRRHIVP
ncbi:MAG TPA: aminopeptidase P N-terminal domain-containing protein [Gemmatimonadaceae bacterium]